MKKMFLLTLFFTMGLLLAACGGNGDDNGELQEPTVQLTRSFEGRNFQQHAIEEVTLTTCIDGDTTQFRIGGNPRQSVRYNAIDTPESTMEFEPWGKRASDYVCERLENAETIVIEGEKPDDRDGNNRVLAYVWVRDEADGEFSLLQLELVRQGYANVYGLGKYDDELRAAQELARNEGLRIWGQDDPYFEQIHDIDNLAYLLDNVDDYIYRPLNITLTVVSHSAGTAVLTDDSTSETIELYYGHLDTSVRIQEAGNVVAFEELFLTRDPFQNRLQLTNYSRHRLQCLDGPCMVYEN